MNPELRPSADGVPAVRTWISAILLAASALLVGISVSAANRARRTWDQQSAQRAQVEAEIAALSQRTLEAPRHAADAMVHARADERSGRSNEAAGTEPTEATRLDSELASESATLRLLRVEAEQKFAPLFRKLALPPDEVARFLAICTDFEERAVSLRAAAKSERVSQDDAAFAAALKAAAAQRTAALRDLVGPDGLRQVQEFERTYWIRDEVLSPLAGDLVFTPEPLGAAQADQLLRLVDAATVGPASGFMDTAVNWDAVAAQSRPFLSNRQLVGLNALASMRKVGQLQQDVRRLIQEPPPNLPP
jgi:hypothetical protein